jgi:SNF family Na+-dependent transporter
VWRKAVLAVHLTVSIGWVGGVLVYLALGLAATGSGDDQTIRAAWAAMDIAGWYALVPMAIATVLTGLVLALGTRWGLLRHYWVLIAFLLTSFSAVILIVHMPSVSATANMIRTADSAQLRQAGGDLFHPTVGLVVLLTVHVLNVYKPPGLTRYGWRKQRASAHAAANDTSH